jgi:hypothetical protein
MKLIFAGIGEDRGLIHRFRTCYQECAEAKRDSDANGRALSNVLPAAYWANEKEGPARGRSFTREEPQEGNARPYQF